MGNLREGDKVQMSDVLKHHRHLKNKTGTVNRIVHSGYGGDDIFVALDEQGEVPFKERELTRID